VEFSEAFGTSLLSGFPWLEDASDVNAQNLEITSQQLHLILEVTAGLIALTASS